MLRLLVPVLLLLSLTARADVTIRYHGCMVGDSLTRAYDFGLVPIPAFLGTLRGVRVTNQGLGGDVASNISARWNRFCKPYAYRFSIWEGCTNDFTAGTAGATCWAVTSAWVTSVKAAGQVPIILSVFPRAGSVSWDAGREAERVAWNAAAAAAAASDPDIIYVNLEAVLGDGASPPALKPMCDISDHLHITEACNELVAEAIDAAMDAAGM